MRISDWSSDVCSSDLPELGFEFLDLICLHDGAIENALFVLLKPLRDYGIAEIGDKGLITRLIFEPQFGDHVEIGRGRIPFLPSGRHRIGIEEIPPVTSDGRKH